MRTSPMVKLEAQLDGQRIKSGETYLIRQLVVEPRALGIFSEAIVQDSDGYLYNVLNAHLAFNLTEIGAL